MMLADLLDAFTPSEANQASLKELIAQYAPRIGQPTPQPQAPQNQAPVDRDTAFTQSMAQPTGQPLQQPAPVSAQPAAPQPQQAAPLSFAPTLTQANSPSIWDRMSALGRGYNQGGLIGGIGDAVGGVNRSLENENLTAQALITKGMDPQTALAVARNPELSKTVIPHAFGPKTIVLNNRLINSDTGKVLADLSDTALKAPETREFTDAVTGDKYQAQWNARLNRWERIDPQSLPVANGSNSPVQPGFPQGQGMPAQVSPASQAATSGQPVQPSGPWAPRPAPPRSLAAIPAPPPGANAQKWREESTKIAADEAKTEREKAEGAIEYLQGADRAAETIRKDGDVIGPFARGNDEDSAISRALGTARTVGQNMVPGWLQRNVPALDFTTANEHRALVDKELRSLGASGLKAIYGSRPTNMDVKQQLSSQASLTSPDAQTALEQLQNNKNKHFETLQHAVDNGIIRPEGIPPQLVAAGIHSGFLKPESFGFTRDNAPDAQPKSNTEAAVQSAKDAIAKGADRNAVIQRLRENGISPVGL